MREILFRGKNHYGEWVFGDFYKWLKTTYIMANSMCSYGKTNILVIPDTVGQFTGLTDKNGTKIFEGDIVKIDNRKYKVSFEKGCYVIMSENFWDFLETNSKSCEVIGNIHDNPELLGGD